MKTFHPEPLNRFVDGQSQEQLETLLLDGLQGHAETMTPEDWRAIQQQALATLNAGKSGR